MVIVKEAKGGTKIVASERAKNISYVVSQTDSLIEFDNLFKVDKHNTQLGIGIDSLPVSIRQSTILSGNNLAQLGNLQELPPVDPTFTDDRLKNIILYYSIDPDEMEKELHYYA